MPELHSRKLKSTLSHVNKICIKRYNFYRNFNYYYWAEQIQFSCWPTYSFLTTFVMKSGSERAESLFLGQQSMSVTKNELPLSVTCTTAPLSGHSVTTVKQIQKRYTLIVPKLITMIVCTDSIDSNSSGWCFRVEEVSVWVLLSRDMHCSNALQCCSRS